MRTALPWLRLFGALAIVWALLTYIGPADLADEYIREAMEKEMRVERVKRAELLCGCQKLHRGKWLRIQVVHQADMKFCKSFCYYEGGEMTEGIL